MPKEKTANRRKMKCSKVVTEATEEINTETITVKPPQMVKDKNGADLGLLDATMKAAKEETDKKILEIWKTINKTMEIKVRTRITLFLNSKRIRSCRLTMCI